MKTSAAQSLLALGLDLSTQSLSVSALNIDSCQKIYGCSLDYVRDSRLAGFGLDPRSYTLPATTEGEANQPVGLYLAALDSLFADMAKADFPLQDVAVVNVSGQQHGHVYLNDQATSVFARLRRDDAVQVDLATLLNSSLAYPEAPIWMTSDTQAQANFMRDNVGGKEKMIGLSGSDSPLRFTGAVIRRTGQKLPAVYRNTARIQLISSFVPAVLTGDSNVPVDFGNGCGTSLMNYTRKRWSGSLIRAASSGLPGGLRALRQKLPGIVEPTAVVGKVARYFSLKYGISPECKVIAGSGDNPQSKVLIAGDLLSLGTSFVNMTSTDGKTLDWSGLANAMYDGIGRPFIFGCRTNGALVWDNLRAMYGLKKGDYAEAEEILRRAQPGQNLVFWQPQAESFPRSGSFDLRRAGGSFAGLENDYSGIVETTLAAVYHYSRSFSQPIKEPLYVTGGAAASREIIRRVAAIWNRPVIRLEGMDAATGAAVAGVYGLLKSQGQKLDAGEFSSTLLKKGAEFCGAPEDASAFHREGGFLDRFVQEYQKLLEQFPLKQ